MSDTVTLLRNAAIRRAVHGPGKSSADARRAAFANANVHAASKITDDDIAAARTAGLSEDEIFEITVCAAYGQALRQLEAGLAALAGATAKTGGA
jgi:alkylhydroperoxidase family enzyme